MYGHVITKFSGMGRLTHFLSYGAPYTLFQNGGEFSYFFLFIIINPQFLVSILVDAIDSNIASINILESDIPTILK